MKQQQEYIQTEEWTCVKTTEEQSDQEVQEDERIEVDDTQ